MPENILLTKLFTPTVSESRISRSRLFSLLDQIAIQDRKFTLISAPAGYGKTTLLASWLQTNRKWKAAWISLDENDNFPGLFFTYFIRALQRIGVSFKQSTVDLLEIQNISLDVIIESVLQDISQSDTKLLLVLDDYHLISNSIIHEAIRTIISGSPSNFRIVIISRIDPPFPLARMRANGQLIEIRQNVLQFNTEEAIAFFNQTMSLALSNKQISLLEKKTEGWIAGLQMAALALQSAQDYDHFLEEFSGSHRYILDYLIEEVLIRQTEKTQRFLSHTSILKQFNADLCAAVLIEYGYSISDCQDILARLERDNLFIIPLDDHRQWYRYHHLFSELLLARLKHKQPKSLEVLHTNASIWFDHHQDSKQALNHAFLAKDYERAADLIEKYSSIHWQITDLNFFLTVNQLPEEVIIKRPVLCLQKAWVGVITGQLNLTKSMLDKTKPYLDPTQVEGRTQQPDQLQGLLAFSKVLFAYLEDMANNHVKLDQSIQEAIFTIPEENVGLRNSIAVVIGSIYFMEGDFEKAALYFKEAIDRDISVKGTNAIPIAASRWARMMIIQGKLHSAHNLCLEYEHYVRERDIRRYYVSGNLLILRANILRRWGQLADAEELVNEGLDLHKNWPVPQGVFMGYVTMAHILLNRFDFSGCEQNLEKAKEILITHQIHPEFYNYFQSVSVKLNCAQDNIYAIEEYISECNPQDFSFRFESQHLTQARALIFLDREAEAIEILNSVIEHTLHEQRFENLIEAYLLLASCQSEQLALASLENALRLAETEGLISPFLEAGKQVFDRLAELNSRSQSLEPPIGNFIQKIIEFTWNGAPTLHGYLPDHQKVENQNLIEPLTSRELEVLQLTADGLSNQDIADQLVISIRTVKKHLQNAYAKLDAKGRVQAINRARELNLI